jgi:hypothetical protein
MKDITREIYGLTDEEYLEYNKLERDQYFRLRLLQVLQLLAIAHGCSCDCDEKDAEIERLKLNQGWNK